MRWASYITQQHIHLQRLRRPIAFPNIDCWARQLAVTVLGSMSASSAAAIITAISDRITTCYIASATSTVYFYDILLTWDDEISLFWNAKGGWLIKLLYLTNRYLPVLGMVCSWLDLHPYVSSTLGCQLTMLGGISCQVVATVVTTAIFSLRARTIYKSMPWVQYVILTAYWISFFAVVILAALAMSWMGPTITFASGICTMNAPMTRRAGVTGGIYIAPLLCETVVLIATARHALDTRRNRQTLQFSSVSPVLQRLYQDSVAYYVIVFGLRLFSSLVWLNARPTLKYFSDYFDYSITSVVTSRFFLALRKSIVDSNIPSHQSDMVETFDGMGGTILFVTSIRQPGPQHELDTISKPEPP